MASGIVCCCCFQIETAELYLKCFSFILFLICVLISCPWCGFYIYIYILFLFEEGTRIWWASKLGWVFFFCSFLSFPSFLSLFSFLFILKSLICKCYVCPEVYRYRKVTRVSPVMPCHGGMDGVVARAPALGAADTGSAASQPRSAPLRLCGESQPMCLKRDGPPQGCGERSVLCAKRPACSFSAGRCCPTDVLWQLWLPRRKAEFHLWAHCESGVRLK